MRQPDYIDIERILALPSSLELTANDLRILINALNALVYFGEQDGEEYIDAEGIELRARLEDSYSGIVDQELAKG